ncbi:MAG: NUDIX domain-containing protein, partial [Anaerolineae bacterium]
AGTVERGEPVETALFREVREETGLSDVRIVRKLALLDERLPAQDLMVTERVVPRAAPHPEAPALEGIVRRGMGFPCRAERDGFAQIAYRAADMAAVPPGAADETCAWIPSCSISRRVRRHVYHLRPLQDTPDEWLVRGAEEDLQFDFALFWTPLWGDPGLDRYQTGWLEAGRRALLARR